MPQVLTSLPGDLGNKLQALAKDSPKQHALIKDLCSEELGQSHLFEKWIAAGSVPPSEIRDLASQLESLDKSYPGGLRSYILKAKKLLKGTFPHTYKKRECPDFLSNTCTLHLVGTILVVFRFQGGC